LEHPPLTNWSIKINYRLFGKYYTRYYNNKDNVLPIIANKEYCVHHDIPFVQWNNNYYRSPEGLVAIKNQSTKMMSLNVLKSLENILKKLKLSIPTFLLSLMKNVKDYFHPLCLFLMDLNCKIYIEFILKLTMTYFNLNHVSCSTYIKIHSQKNLINILKNEFDNLNEALLKRRIITVKIS